MVDRDHEELGWYRIDEFGDRPHRANAPLLLEPAALVRITRDEPGDLETLE